jgi:hypothetical protein
MDVQKEANFMKGVELYIKEHGRSNFYDVIPPKSKKKLLPASIDLPIFRKADIAEFQENVDKSVEKYKSLYNRFKHVPHVDFLIYRYDVMGFLGNISLSVPKRYKQKWGITNELFGSFYNTDYPYCSLFPDLEPGSLGNVFYFKPKEGMVILANPPYTSSFIKWTIKKVLEWKGIAKMICILPVWDKKSRDSLGYSKQQDLPEIQTLIEHSERADIVDLPFYDGIHNKQVHLKDKVHIIHI